MARILTTCDLINTSLRRAMIPSDQATFTACDIMDIMNEELKIHIVPMILRAHEEYYVVDEDQPLVSGRARYKIPYRAIGNKLRDLQFVDTSGSHYEMTRVSIEDRPEYQRNTANSQLFTFYVENDDVVLMSSVNSSGDLRSSFFLTPNELVKSTRAAKISAIIEGACNCTTFVVDCLPTHMTSETTFDFIQGRSPNKILTYDVDVTSLCATSKTFTFANSELTEVDLTGSTPPQIQFAVGDYIMSVEETIVAQIPSALQPILAQRTAIKMLEALGDADGMKMAQNELERMEYNAQTLIDNRVEGAPQKVVNRHSSLKSTLHNKLFSRRGV